MGDILKLGLFVFLFCMGPIGWIILYFVFVNDKD